MRVALAAIAALSSITAADRAAAVEYPWCAHYSMNGDVSNCGFVSYQQCRMTATAGTAGLCLRNPFYVATSASKPKAATRRQH